LGAGIRKVFSRVYLPLGKKGLITACMLVFVDVLKELPLTLILRPFNFETLATKAFEYASDEMLMKAALPSLLIVLVGLIPVFILHKSLDHA
jgi:iron(III) transport system permease protein